jgi:hypothetical protein
MLTSRTSDYYMVRANRLRANGKENVRIVQKLERQARKAKEKELASSF